MRSIALIAMMSGVAHASVVDLFLGHEARPPAAPAETRRDPPRRVTVNGVEVWLAVAESHAPPAQVRRYYQATEILSSGDDERGMLLAVDRANDAGGSFGERLGRFVARDDLNELVRLQLVLYRRTASGGTELVHLWPASAVSPEAAAAAPATEVPPGPPGFERVLTSGERGEPSALALYSGRGSASWVLRWFRERLRRDGWQEDPSYQSYAARRGRSALRFHRRGRDVYIDVDVEGAEGTLSVCVIRMG